MIFGHHRSVSNESRMGTRRGTKRSCFSGSFGRIRDAISIGDLAKFQVRRWTVESKSPDDGTRMLHGCVYERKTGSGRVEGIGKLIRSHSRRNLFRARECRCDDGIRAIGGRAI